jgi:hypothetical protein
MHSGIEVHIIRIHQHIEKNSVSLKEVLMPYSSKTAARTAMMRRLVDEKCQQATKTCAGNSQGFLKKPCAAVVFCIQQISDRCAARIVASRSGGEINTGADSESRLLAIKIFSPTSLKATARCPPRRIAFANREIRFAKIDPALTTLPGAVGSLGQVANSVGTSS